MPTERTCRKCGCTDHAPCATNPERLEQPDSGVAVLWAMLERTYCHWVGPDLCSACAPPSPEGTTDDPARSTA